MKLELRREEYLPLVVEHCAQCSKALRPGSSVIVVSHGTTFCAVHDNGYCWPMWAGVVAEVFLGALRPKTISEDEASELINNPPIAEKQQVPPAAEALTVNGDNIVSASEWKQQHPNPKRPKRKRRVQSKPNRALRR